MATLLKEVLALQHAQKAATDWHWCYQRAILGQATLSLAQWELPQQAATVRQSAVP
jgi:hypothetical protein